MRNRSCCWTRGGRSAQFTSISGLIPCRPAVFDMGVGNRERPDPLLSARAVRSRPSSAGSAMRSRRSIRRFVVIDTPAQAHRHREHNDYAAVNQKERSPMRLARARHGPSVDTPQQQRHLAERRSGARLASVVRRGRYPPHDQPRRERPTLRVVDSARRDRYGGDGSQDGIRILGDRDGQHVLHAALVAKAEAGVIEALEGDRARAPGDPRGCRGSRHKSLRSRLG